MKINAGAKNPTPILLGRSCCGPDNWHPRKKLGARLPRAPNKPRQGTINTFPAPTIASSASL